MTSKDFLFEPNMQHTHYSSVEITCFSNFKSFPSAAKATKNNRLLMATSKQRFWPLRKKDDT